jgi:hypothetical protein
MDNNSLLQKTYQTEFGVYGPPTAITGTSAITGQFIAFQVFEADTVIETMTLNGVVITAFSATQLPSGFVVYGLLTSIKLSAGNGLAYAGNNNVNTQG